MGKATVLEHPNFYKHPDLDRVLLCESRQENTSRSLVARLRADVQQRDGSSWSWSALSPWQDSPGYRWLQWDLLYRCQNLQFWTWTSGCWICHPKGRLLFNWDSAEDMKEMMLMNYLPISAILRCRLHATSNEPNCFSFLSPLGYCKSVARKPSHGLPRSTKGWQAMGFNITNRRWHLVLPNEQLTMVKFGAPTTLTYPNQNLHPSCTNFCP